jgi:hypothetical protein
MNTHGFQQERRAADEQDTGRPAVIAGIEKARRMLSAFCAQLAQRILDCTLGGRGDVHILREERARDCA